MESKRPITEVARDLEVRQAEADSGSRPDLPTSVEREEIRKLHVENF